MQTIVLVFPEISFTAHSAHRLSIIHTRAFRNESVTASELRGFPFKNLRMQSSALSLISFIAIENIMSSVENKYKHGKNAPVKSDSRNGQRSDSVRN